MAWNPNDMNNNEYNFDESDARLQTDDEYRRFPVADVYHFIPEQGLSEVNSSDEDFYYYVIAPKRGYRMATGRSTQLKNLRDATRSLKDRLSDGDGMFDGADGGQILWYIAQVEDILRQYTETDLKEEDRCALMINCMTGNAKQVVNAAK